MRIKRRRRDASPRTTASPGDALISAARNSKTPVQSEGSCPVVRAGCLFFESSSRSVFLIEHDLFGKPVPTFPDHALADHTPRPLAGGRGRGGLGGSFQAADRNFKAGHTFVAGHRGHAAGAHGAEERDQFGAQRLVMADGQMTHRIAAVRLETETFGYLAGEKIAHDVLAAG